MIDEQQVNVSADSEASANGFTKYLDLSKTPLCVSRYLNIIYYVYVLFTINIY